MRDPRKSMEAHGRPVGVQIVLELELHGRYRQFFQREGPSSAAPIFLAPPNYCAGRDVTREDRTVPRRVVDDGRHTDIGCGNVSPCGGLLAGFFCSPSFGNCTAAPYSGITGAHPRPGRDETLQQARSPLPVFTPRSPRPFLRAIGLAPPLVRVY